MSVRHFIDIHDHDAAALRGILDAAMARKLARAGAPRGQQDADKPLEGRVLAMIFEKPSTRTRVSFDVGMRQLGGETIVLRGDEMQLGRGETVADTARVLSRYVDAIMIRTHAHDIVEELAEHASVPVINGLTDGSHPCQIMADLQTIEEHRGPITGKSVAWVGDGNNVAASFVHAAGRLDFEIRVATPDALRLDGAVRDWARAEGVALVETDDPVRAVTDADCVVADTWVSMGDKDAASRHNLLKPYQVTEELMANANSDALFLHCLPAHRGEEVTASVIDGPQSVIFDEAENRLHAQKAILTWCLGVEG
ncbi:MAG: ornithine carbamoyltransferase [Alphaproteobacteria bacterium]